MDIDPKFQEKVSKKIWDDYIYRVSRTIRHLNKEQRNEIKLELKSHLFESFSERESDNEVENLIDAMESLGKPEEYLKTIAADKVLKGTGKFLNPKNLMLGVFYSSVTSLKLGALMISFGIGYLTSLIFALIGIIRIFSPEHAGFFIYPNGGYIIGLTGASTLAARDVFGAWTSPLFLLVAIILYISLSVSLKRILKQ